MNPHLSLHDVGSPLNQPEASQEPTKLFLLTGTKEKILHLIIFHIRGL
jgi:hypothetical protein